MAWQYWRNRGDHGRRTFIALDHAYHGDTVGAMSVSEASSFTEPFASLLFSIVRAHEPYCYRCPGRFRSSKLPDRVPGSSRNPPKGSGRRRCRRSRRTDATGCRRDDRVAVEFLAGVRDLCNRYGTLMIADEVLTGFGRTGRMFACEHAAVTPDIICLSKGLTAGYLPMGATVATELVYEAFLSDDRQKTFFHGHSYTANPLACAVALASLDLFRDDGVLARISALEAQLRSGFEQFRELPSVGDVRVIGGVGAVELTDADPKAGGGYFDQRGPRIANAFLQRNLLLRPLGNVVYFMPPYVISEAETAGVLEAMRSVLAEVD